jgi:hypothetical protein
MPRLVALGDSMTQGVNSGAVWKTQWSYPALVARCLGESVGFGGGFDFCVPHYGMGGLPLNIERLLHDLQFQLGGGGLDLIDWVLAAKPAVENWLEERDEYYEHGYGARARSFAGPYHLLACFSFTVADLYGITGEYCDAVIRRRRWDERSQLIEKFPSSAVYRAARRILNPAAKHRLNKHAMVDWLGEIERTQGPIENLILNIGLNNAAGTITSLEIVETGPEPPKTSLHEEFSLWHPAAFEASYRELARRIDEQTDARVFVATLPYVTIAPLLRGVGPRAYGPKGEHHEFYIHFYNTDDDPDPADTKHLTVDDVLYIEGRIDAYNEAIGSIADEFGWHIVDNAWLLNGLAGRGDYRPDVFLRRFLGGGDHPLLQLTPLPRLELYRVDEEGNRYAGGLVSLDCFHGSTCGLGLLARLFVNALLEAGVEFRDAAGQSRPPDEVELPWERIIAVDHLLMSPPPLWRDLLQAGEHVAEVWERIGGVISLFSQ